MLVHAFRREWFDQPQSFDERVALASSRFRFSTVYSTVGQNFDAKLCNSAERTAKAKLRTTQHQQRYAKQ